MILRSMRRTGSGSTSHPRADSLGEEDLYACFRGEEGSWSAPENLGPGVNSAASDWLASFSPDGDGFFFTSFRRTTPALEKRKRAWLRIDGRTGSARDGDL